MKSKLSITLDKELIEKVEEFAKQGLFRNKSAVVEAALKVMIEALD